jgi:hypothetical protein
LITAEDEEQMNAETTPPELPILPLRNTVLFPGVVIPITVGRDRSIRLIQDVYRGNRTFGVVSQKDGQIEEPRAEDLNSIGTIATIIRMLRMPDGSTTAIIQGKKRFEITGDGEGGALLHRPGQGVRGDPSGEGRQELPSVGEFAEGHGDGHHQAESATFPPRPSSRSRTLTARAFW